MNGNKLRYLPSTLFHRLSILDYLGLSGNNLSNLPNDIFCELGLLRALYLDHELCLKYKHTNHGQWSNVSIQISGEESKPIKHVTSEPLRVKELEAKLALCETKLTAQTRAFEIERNNFDRQQFKLKDEIRNKREALLQAQDALIKAKDAQIAALKVFH